MSIVISLIIFGIIVLIHEFGHFIAARRCGILVEEFAIGMGPKIFSVQGKETLYSIRILPIGGFCKMLGEDNNSSDSRALSNKTILQRFIVISAGAFMNFVLAFVIFLLLTFFNGFVSTTISSLVDNYPASQAGIEVGDKITSINGSKIHIYQDLSFLMSENKGEPIEVKIKRNGETLIKRIVPQKDESGRWLIGFTPSAKYGFFAEPIEGYSKASFLESSGAAFWTMVFSVKSTIIGFVKIFTFSISADQVAGPIGIVQIIGDTYQTGMKENFLIAVENLAMLAAFLSANLGVVNLFPIPALDGGRLMFLILEAIRRKPVSADKEGMVHFVGFVLLMGLMIVIAYNDITRLF